MKSLFWRIFIFVNIMGIALNYALWYFLGFDNVFIRAFFEKDMGTLTLCILSYIVLTTLLYFVLSLREMVKNA